MANSSDCNRIVRAFALLSLASAAGCSTSITVKSGVMPDAVVQKVPLTIGLRHSESVRAYTYEEKLAGGETYRINLGAASQEMFDTTFDDLFESVILVEPGIDVPPVDLLVETEVNALEFIVPSQTVTNDYAIWIKYQIKVYDSQGTLQADYLVPAYGKAPKDGWVGGANEALTVAAQRALRDAATLLLTRFVADARLEGRQLTRVRLADEPATTPPTLELPANEPVEDEAPPPAIGDNAEQYL